jgi:epoxide hydrolase-like predicted phosphatase
MSTTARSAVTSTAALKTTVIFDFGGVFIDSPFTALADAASSRGLSADELSLAVFGDYASDTDHPWHRLERGEITVVEAREGIMAASEATFGAPLDPFDLLAALAGGGIREEFVELTRSLRSSGLKTGLLTNNAKEFEEFWRPVLPLDELFDDVVDSSQVGLRKPDPAIYNLALERLGSVASEAVFVDDAPGNTVGAERVGIAAVLVGPTRAEVPDAIEAIRKLVFTQR